MNTSYATEYTIAPLCIAPFSMTDFVYNPSCYLDSGMGLLKEVLDAYLMFNLLLLQLLFRLAQTYGVLLAIAFGIGFSCFWIIKWTLLEELDEPLSDIESESMQYIRLNASTGCTTQMLYEHLTHVFPDVELHAVKGALMGLKNKGRILSTQTTLWVVSGN